MASSSHGVTGYPALERQNDDADDARSESGSSHIGSDESGPAPNTCLWRTARFYDQECSRYFDCPSHIVERSLSDSGATDDAGDADDATPIVDTTNIRTEGDSNNSEDSSYPRLSIRSDSVASDSETGHPPILDTLSRSSSTPGTSNANVESSSQTRRASVPHLELPPRTTSLLRSPSISPSSQASRSNPPRASGIPQSPRHRELEAPHTAGPSRSITSHIPHSDGIPRDFSEIILPRWQPDSDVTLCPICRSQFSFFVRKHHCRKCGRVVCNACSPHRITIPNQYIVRPPGQDGASQLYINPLSMDRGLPDATGGERVRLCNPCVPDPNTTPPLPASSSTQLSPGSHYRSQSSLSSGLGGYPQGANTGLFLQSPVRETYARRRSITMNSPPAPPHGSAPQFLSTRNQILAGTPPVYYPASSAAHYPGARLRYLPLRESAGASSSTQRPLPPTPQMAEEDECPVCHRELPSSTLPNHEVLRESHINSCISAHSRYGGGTASSPNPEGGEEGEGPASPRSVRRTGMFPYVATEKDCVDSAECTICLEEFEVGVPMARLECLCRFHHRCISAWFVNHPGRCPVHQHDSYGY